MNPRAIVCVSNDLLTDQRVHKTCLTLQKSGYEVLELGRLLPDSQPLERPYSTKRMKLLFNSGPFFYAELNIRMFFLLLFSRVDLIFSNDLDTLLGCYLGSKIRNKRLIYDSHELFTELPELQERKSVKLIWERIEKSLLPRLKNCITVCASIADYYKNKYNTDMVVVRNIPLNKKNTFNNLKLDLPDKKIIIYQGALNRGRCLENVLHAMTMVNDGYLLVIGDGDLKADLQALSHQLGVENKVGFLGKVDGTILHQYTHHASLGLCLMKNDGLNYYYSLPNRVFDYLNAGIPVLASDFPEIRNVVGRYNTGILVTDISPENIARQINQILTEGFDTSHFDDVSSELCWENEERSLIELITSI